MLLGITGKQRSTTTPETMRKRHITLIGRVRAGSREVWIAD
jgi:hypothetical protein